MRCVSCARTMRKNSRHARALGARHSSDRYLHLERVRSWLVLRRWTVRACNSFSPQRGEGGQRPDEGWERLRLRFVRLNFKTSADVTTPPPVEGRGRTTFVAGRNFEPSAFHRVGEKNAG